MHRIIVAVLLGAFFVNPVFGDEAKRKEVIMPWDRGRTPIYAWSHRVMMINDPASPVQITSGELYSFGRPFIYPRHFRHKLPSYMVKMTAKGQNVEVVEYGVLLYDSFGESAGGVNPLDSHFKSGKRQEWSTKIRPPLSFYRFGVGCFFVRTVRLQNGDIWKMNTNYLAQEMQKRGCSKRKSGEIKQHLKKKGSGSVTL